MRIAPLTVSALLFVFGGCGLFSSESEDSFTQPNTLMAEEIDSRIEQIPYQHRDELLQNLLWMAQTGETTIPALLRGLKHNNPKVRSSCAWVLGRIHDRRTIPALQAAGNDSNQTVKLEVARTLVALGDLQQSPVLIEGLDSERKEVRYLCHEMLKTATGRDFGFDHLSENETQRRQAVLGWRQWWSEYSGDPFFAQSYQQRHGLNPASPMGETQGQEPQDPQSKPQDGTTPNADDGVILVQPEPQGSTPNTGATPTPDAPPSGSKPSGGTPTTGTNGPTSGGRSGGN